MTSDCQDNRRNAVACKGMTSLGTRPGHVKFKTLSHVNFNILDSTLLLLVDAHKLDSLLTVCIDCTSYLSIRDEYSSGHYTIHTQLTIILSYLVRTQPQQGTLHLEWCLC